MKDAEFRRISKDNLAQISHNLLAYLKTEFGNPQLAYKLPLLQIQGGCEAYIFSFTLHDNSQEFSKPLVLRLYPPMYGSRRVILESCIQNAMASTGYPAPRAYAACTDKSVLGGIFLVMDCLPGTTMFLACQETMPEMLAQSHLNLHRIDLSLIDKTWNLARFQYSMAERLDWFKLCAKQYTWLSEAIDWLVRKCPPQPEHPAICHCDFHPLNVLVERGAVTGVLDWAAFIIGDPALDVAATMACLTIGLPQLYPAIKWKDIANRYLATYRFQQACDLSIVDYYKVLKCVTAFLDRVDGQGLLEQLPHAEIDIIDCIRDVTRIWVIPPTFPKEHP